MCGCDYNTNIKNYGPKKAYDLIKRYGSIDEIQKKLEGLDMTCLNHKICIDYLTPKDFKIPSDTINVDIEKSHSIKLKH
jgi:5'-3' exonuclease